MPRLKCLPFQLRCNYSPADLPICATAGLSHCSKDPLGSTHSKGFTTKNYVDHLPCLLSFPVHQDWSKVETINLTMVVVMVAMIIEVHLAMVVDMMVMTVIHDMQ